MNRGLKSGFMLVITIAICLILPPALFAENAPDSKPLVYTVEIHDTVTVGTARHVKRAIETAEKEKANALIILLNTPGGLVSATLDIIKDISTSQVPVVTYVTPQGGIAASAGTFILLDGHIAAMSPGTTCGAAMPITVSMPGTEPQAADQKTVNFLAGHMKSVAQERGRPADLAEQFVTENLTLNYQEALDKGVIDLIATDINELLAKIDNQKVKMDAGIVTLKTNGAKISNLTMETNEKFINTISNPTLAMIFLILGLYGLIIGFSSPGFFFPEVLGGISLILGLYGIGLFEVNLAAGLLVLLGIGLLIAEAFTPTYGILGVGGVTSIVLGTLFFPVEPLMPPNWINSIKFLSVGIGLISAVFVFVVLLGIFRLRKAKVVHGDDEFSESLGIVVDDLNPEGAIRIRGEIWKAITKNGDTVARGEKVKITGRKGLLLVVESLSKQDHQDK